MFSCHSYFIEDSESIPDPEYIVAFCAVRKIIIALSRTQHKIMEKKLRLLFPYSFSLWVLCDLISGWVGCREDTE